MQLLLALEYLHENFHIVYRDLKPENIMLDSNGNTKIIDFGISKYNSTVCNTFCGTPQYLPPEIIQHKPYNQMVDFWNLGCILFELISGYPPFDANQVQENLFRQILTKKYQLPKFVSETVQDLISKLLEPSPEHRLGANGMSEIKLHPFFQRVDWIQALTSTQKGPLTVKIDALETMYKALNVKLFNEELNNAKEFYLADFSFNHEQSYQQSP